jgi:hypothetical protein
MEEAMIAPALLIVVAAQPLATTAMEPVTEPALVIVIAPPLA